MGGSSEDWQKVCMEYRVESRRPVGRPRRIWLESVNAGMAELETEEKFIMTGRNGERML